MCNIETLYSSYQELLLDLDIYGRLVGSQALDDKEAFKDLLFQEYAKARPIPTLESRDCELSEPVSEDFHVSYRNELELSQGEEVISWDDDDDEEVEDSGAYEDVVIPDDFPKELFNKPISLSERDAIVCNNAYFTDSFELEEFKGDVDEVVGNFGSIEQSDELVYTDDEDEDLYTYEDESEDETVYEEDVGEDEFYYDDEEDYNYEEDEVYEDEEQSEGYTESSESTQDDDFYDFEEEEIDFVDEVYDNPEPVVQKPRDIEVKPPPIVLPNLTEPKQTVEVKEEVPSDILQYLRLHPRCEISEVLKYYPRKDLERYIRIGKVIKKGSKVYI